MYSRHRPADRPGSAAHAGLFRLRLQLPHIRRLDPTSPYLLSSWSWRPRELWRAAYVAEADLTAISQTVRMAPDPGVLMGRVVDPDLWKRICQHPPDTRQSSGGQGVAGSNPAVPTNVGGQRPFRRSVGWPQDRLTGSFTAGFGGISRHPVFKNSGQCHRPARVCQPRPVADVAGRTRALAGSLGLPL